MLSLVALSVVAAARTAAANELLFGNTVPDFSVPDVSGSGELAGAVHFAAAAVIVGAVDSNEDACSTAVDVVTYCYDVLPTTAPVIDQAYCFCCYDEVTTTEFLAPVYSSCEAYIDTAAPTNTAASSVISVVESFCYSVSNEGFSCETTTSATARTAVASASASATATPTTTFATTSAASTDEPAGCFSFGSLYDSCAAATRGFTTMNDADAASCLCYKNGRYTTAIDDYISQCAVWISTASPDEYDTYVALETYCEDYAPGSTSVVATFSDKIATFGGDSSSASASAGASASAAATASTTKTPKTVTVTPTSTPTAATNAAGRVAQGGFAAWLAVVLPFVL